MNNDTINTFRCACAALLERYVKDVEEIVDIFASAAVDNEPHDTERPPAFAAEAGTFEPTTRTLGDDDEVLLRHETPSELRWEAIHFGALVEEMDK